MLIAMLAGLILIVGTAFRNKMGQLLAADGLLGAQVFRYFDPGRLHRLPITIPKK